MFKRIFASMMPAALALSFGCEELGNLTKPKEIDPEISHRTPAKTRHAMVLVPEGPFILGTTAGAQDESPTRSIELAPYYIDQFEITNALWNGYAKEKELPQKEARTNTPLSRSPGNKPTPTASGPACACPLKPNGKRRPGARRPAPTPGGNGPPSRTLANFANADGLVRVGSFPEGVSPFAVHDMAGNVQEWVADWYNSAYYNSAPPRNPAGPNQGIWRGVRGSSFQDQNELRITKRNSAHPTSAQAWIGFRCVRDLE